MPRPAITPRCLVIPVLFLAVLGCGPPEVGPSPSGRSLEVQVARDVLAVGEADRATARLHDGPVVRDVSADWLSTDSAIVAIDPSGTIASRSVGQVEVRAKYEDLEGARALVIVASFAGVWRGQVTTVSCQRESGPGPNACRFILHGEHPIVVDIRQQGSQLSGTLSLFQDAVSGALNVGVTARTAKNMRPLRLTSSRQTATVTTLAMTVEESELRIDELQIRREEVNAWGRQVYLETYRMMAPLSDRSDAN